MQTDINMVERSLWNLLWYNFLKRLLQLAGVVGYGIRHAGRENIPTSGGVLVVCNHQSHFDPPFVGMGVARRMNYLARDTLFRFAPFRWLIHSVDAIPIDREGIGLNGIKESLRRLRRGEMVLIFPEGTRTRDGEIAPFKPGFTVLAARERGRDSSRGRRWGVRGLAARPEVSRSWPDPRPLWPAAAAGGDQGPRRAGTGRRSRATGASVPSGNPPALPGTTRGTIRSSRPHWVWQLWTGTAAGDRLERFSSQCSGCHAHACVGMRPDVRNMPTQAWAWHPSGRYTGMINALGPADVWVGHSLAPDGCRGAVAGQELGLVRQREEFLANSAGQAVEIAVGEIAAANPAEEDHVADQDQHRLMVPQQIDDVAQRMAGNCKDVDVDPSSRKDLAVADRDVRRGANHRKSIARRKVENRIGQLWRILDADDDLAGRPAPLQGRVSSDMVGVAVGDEDGRRRQAVSLQVIDDLRPVHAGIDHEAVVAAIAMEYVSIFAEFFGNYAGEANRRKGG